jgi:hypothetical protein
VHGTPAPESAQADDSWPSLSTLAASVQQAAVTVSAPKPTEDPKPAEEDDEEWPSVAALNRLSTPARDPFPRASTPAVEPLAPLASPVPLAVPEPLPAVGGRVTAFAPSTPRTPLPDPFAPTAARKPGPELFASAPARTPVPDPFAPDSRREPTGEHDSRLATAFEAMTDLYFLPTPVAGLEFTIELFGRLVPCEAASGCLYDINMDVFRFVALSGPGASERRAGSVPSQAGLFGAAKRDQREALIVNDVATDARYNASADGRDGLEARTLAYLPVRVGGHLLGMLQLINRSNERGFTTSDVAVLTYVTGQLAEFLSSRRSLRG